MRPEANRTAGGFHRPVSCAIVLAFVALTRCSAAEPVEGPASQAEGTFPSGDAVLSYSLDLPPGAGPFPAVVLVHGSGRVTRQDVAPIAKEFVQRGFAVLRYDKRGVGQSTGIYSGVSVDNSSTMIPLLASDAAAGVAVLAQHPLVDPRRIGLAGFSQAGWIIPVAAERASQVSFAVIMSGPTVSVGLEMFYSGLAEGTTVSQAVLSERLKSFSGPAGFDPRAYLERSRVQTLWLYGADDRSIPARECIAIHDVLRQHPGPRFTVREYPGLGHGLSRAIWPDIETWLRQLPSP